MKILSILFLCLCLTLRAQLKENFESATIQSWEEFPDHSWSIDSLFPLSGKYSLRHSLDDTVSSSSGISLCHDRINPESPAAWKFKIRHGYNPSSSNNWAVFFISDRDAAYMHPDSNGNGFLAGVNYTGSDDMIKIWKKTGRKSEFVLNTGLNWQNVIGTSGYADFLIEKDENGQFTLKIDTSESGEYSFHAGSFIDTFQIRSACFGVFYEYSSSQDMKLWLDDVEITGRFEKDTSTPVLRNYWFSGEKSITLEYDETVYVARVDILSTDLSGNGIEAFYPDGEKITIFFTRNFMDKNLYSLILQDVSDICKNKGVPDTINLFFYMSRQNDVVITEIMADPDPSVHLPEAEYIEIYNRSGYPVCLDGWNLCIGNSCSLLSKVTMFPRSYLILSDQDYSGFFSQESVTIYAEKFPQISNSGQIITLKDRNGDIIFSIEYSDEWYGNPEKQNGGWSLEMIDPDNPCGKKENWTASANKRGGTPGHRNSVFANNPDTKHPYLYQAVIVNDTTLYLHFPEKITGYDPSSFSVDNGIGPPYSLSTDLLSERFFLYFKNPFREKILYTLSVQYPIYDCYGNGLNKNSVVFRKSSPCFRGDLVINEILFDPFEEDGEFVELYNRSSKTINLQNYGLYLRDASTHEMKSMYLLTAYPFTVEPREYAILTHDPEKVTRHYKSAGENAFLTMRYFPALSNDEAIIGICNPDSQMIDEFHYTHSLIHEMIIREKGISLERVSTDADSETEGNWHSASADAGFATPGYINSQAENKTKNFTLTVEPEVFSPDFDGYNDEVSISYSFETGGLIANIFIFDRDGRLVKTVARNSLLGTTGSFTWDGLTSGGMRVPVGIYLIYFEAFGIRGEVIQERITCTVAEKIN